MADFSKTISNSINCLGPAPSTKWGTGTPYTMTWGTSKWGEGTEDLQIAFIKVISESVIPSDSVAKSASKQLSDSLTLSGDMGSESLQDGSGYYYVFSTPTTDGESRLIPTYAEGSVSSQSYTCLSVASINWS